MLHREASRPKQKQTVFNLVLEAEKSRDAAHCSDNRNIANASENPCPHTSAAIVEDVHCGRERNRNNITVDRDVAAAPQTPQLGEPRPTLGAQVSLKLLFGYVTIFSSADLFTTDLNCRKKLACDIISKCNVILSRRI